MNKEKITVLTISMFCILALMVSFASADRLLINGFESPFDTTNTNFTTPNTLGGTDGPGLIASVTNSVSHSGSQSLKWAQTPSVLSTGFNGGTYPKWQYKNAYFNGSVLTSGALYDYTGATVLSAWLYWDIGTTNGPAFWTIQFGLGDTVANHDLGNWNENGTFAASSMYHTWYYRQWPTAAGGLAATGTLLNAIKQVYCYSHAADYGNLTTASGTITIYIDDVKMEGPTGSVPEWSLYDTPVSKGNVSEAVIKE